MATQWHFFPRARIDAYEWSKVCRKEKHRFGRKHHLYKKVELHQSSWLYEWQT